MTRSNLINSISLGFLILGFGISTGEAANFYVRQGAAGGNNGSDWTNAYTAVPANLNRGDIYYIADGSYGSYTFDDAVGSGQVITIKKAVESDHGTAIGWNSTYGDGQAVFTHWDVFTDYYVFDGQVRNSNWDTGAVNQYGMKVASVPGTNIKTLRLDNGSGTGGDNLTFKYIDFQGGGSGGTGAGDDVVYGLTGNSNVTFSKCALHDSDRTIFLMRGEWQNLLVEYSFMGRNNSTTAIHGELLSDVGSDFATFRNNVIEDTEGTTAGFAFMNGSGSKNSGNTANGWKIYNNIFRSTVNGGGISYGVIFVANDTFGNANWMDNSMFANNTIVNLNVAYSMMIFHGPLSSGTGNVVVNNVFYNNPADSPGDPAMTNAGTLSYNWYYNTGNTGDNGTGKTVCASSCSGYFQNAAGMNMALVAPLAGTPLAAEYNTDFLGNIRGVNGAWDQGAYEYTGGAPATYNLSVTKAGTGTGTVTSSGGSINCGPTCSVSGVAAGTVSTLTAAPGAGSSFTGWSGACTGTGLCTVTINADTSVTATFAASAATSFYIRDGGTSSSCTDWTNACDQLPSTLVRGAIYYVAAGTYNNTTLNTPVNGTSIITIKGATIADHGPAAGWNGTYSVCSGEGGTQAQFPNGWGVSTGFWTIDGSCGSGSANNGTTSGYGFRSRSASDGQGAVGFEFTATPLSGITISHYDIDGINCCTMAVTANGKDGMLSTGGGVVNGLFDHLYIHDVGRTAFLMGGNITLQYSYLARNRSTAAMHAEGWSNRGGTVILRWNIFEDIRGTGQFVQLYGTGTNHEVYGNVFRRVQGSCPTECGASSFPVIDNTGTGVINGLKFYNNTIYGFNGNPGAASINGSTGYNVKNNLWVNNNYGASIDGTQDYNNVWGTYWYGGLVGSNSSWRCIQSGGIDPSGNCAGNNSLVAPSAAAIFVAAPLDLRLTGNTVSGFTMLGTNLGAPYNVDMNGNIRTNWTRGAYEYTATGTDTTPPIVTAFTLPSTSASLVVSPISITATDSVGVTGYMVTESATAPLASASGWSATVPASYTFAAQGVKTLYAWAKDAAGNVSASRSASVTITFFVYHPADGDSSKTITLNEATGYGACWKSAPTIPAGCPSPAATLNDAVRAGYLWNGSAAGDYHYIGGSCSGAACWDVGP